VAMRMQASSPATDLPSEQWKRIYDNYLSWPERRALVMTNSKFRDFFDHDSFLKIKDILTFTSSSPSSIKMVASSSLWILEEGSALAMRFNSDDFVLEPIALPKAFSAHDTFAPYDTGFFWLTDEHELYLINEDNTQVHVKKLSDLDGCQRKLHYYDGRLTIIEHCDVDNNVEEYRHFDEQPNLKVRIVRTHDLDRVHITTSKPIVFNHCIQSTKTIAAELHDGIDYVYLERGFKDLRVSCCDFHDHKLTTCYHDKDGDAAVTRYTEHDLSSRIITTKVLKVDLPCNYIKGFIGEGDLQFILAPPTAGPSHSLISSVLAIHDRGSDCTILKRRLPRDPHLVTRFKNKLVVIWDTPCYGNISRSLSTIDISGWNRGIK